MTLYAFELGRKFELCQAELFALFDKKNCVDVSRSTAIFELPEIENPQELQDRLGGTIKIIKISGSVNQQDLKTEVAHLLQTHCKDFSGKVPFSVSVFGFKPREINLKVLLNDGKRALKAIGLSSRFVNQGNKNPNSKSIFKSKMMERGLDINIIKSKDKIYIGHSVSIQNITSYTKRDFQKPIRDAKIGMTPPKLAQIMINLAGPKTKTILDPFCGTGTYLMEALMMEKNAIGSDIEPKMIKASETNLLWLNEEFQTKAESYIFERDARFLTKEQLPISPDAVITEGYLGPALEEVPNREKQEVIFRELANLHLNWLVKIHQLTSDECKVVTCIAAFKKPGSVIHLPKFEQIAETAGYKIDQKFIYERKGQIVVRDIAVLSKI